MPDYQVHYIST